MAEELELDLDLEDQNLNNRAESRIKDLSSKVRTTAEERDQAKAALEAAGTSLAAAEKERDFFASFSDVATKQPAASEYKDAIKEKVLAGYSVEDATVAVLAAAGKYTPPAVESAPQGPAAGGSAPTALPSSGETKTLSEMNREEKRAEVIKAIERGDIGVS